MRTPAEPSPTPRRANANRSIAVDRPVRAASEAVPGMPYRARLNDLVVNVPPVIAVFVNVVVVRW
jgi:hypothetical protein